MGQILLNSIITSCNILLVAIGFNLIYGTNRFFHFAHGIIYTIGAYSLFYFFKISNIDLFISIIFSVLFCSLIGLLIGVFIYKPIRRRNGTPLMLLIASLGVYIVFQNLISILFGENTKTLRSGVIEKGMYFIGFYITPINIVLVLITFMLFLFTWYIIKYTKLGKATMAVSNNPTLAELVGIKKENIYNFVLMYGSMLACIAGILAAFDTDVRPIMGFRILLLAIIASIIGGIGSISGAAVGSLLIGFSHNIIGSILPSQWQDTFVLFILIIFLIARPEGIFGKPIKKSRI